MAQSSNGKGIGEAREESVGDGFIFSGQEKPLQGTQTGTQRSWKHPSKGRAGETEADAVKVLT